MSNVILEELNSQLNFMAFPSGSVPPTMRDRFPFGFSSRLSWLWVWQVYNLFSLLLIDLHLNTVQTSQTRSVVCWVCAHRSVCAYRAWAGERWECFLVVLVRLKVKRTNFDCFLFRSSSCITTDTLNFTHNPVFTTKPEFLSSAETSLTTTHPATCTSLVRGISQ